MVGKHERKILEKIRWLLPISSEHRHSEPLAFVCGGVAIRACAPVGASSIVEG
jgi:hypothetical protein